MRTSKLLAIAILILSFVIGPSVLAGQHSTPSQPLAGTQILFLGTAGGPPLRADRSEPATLLVVNGRRYLIDCGIGTARRLVEAGIRSETIGTIFLTHLHPDHDLGLADVLANDFQNLDLSGPGHTISIYGPLRTQELIDAAYRFISIPYAVFAAEGGGPRGGIPATPPFSVHEYHAGVVYQDDRIRVVAVENSHYALMPQKFRITMKSYSLRFETPYGTILFTGDTGPDAAVERLAEGADVLIAEVENYAAVTKFVDQMARQNHWSSARRNKFEAHMTKEHLDINDVGRMAARAHVKAVVLYHWYPDDPAIYVTGVEKYFSGPVYASADLQRYCLPAVSPNDPPRRSLLHLCM